MSGMFGPSGTGFKKCIDFGEVVTMYSTSTEWKIDERVLQGQSQLRDSKNKCSIVVSFRLCAFDLRGSP